VYWAVEGLIVLCGSLSVSMLSLNRTLLFLRSIAGVVTSLVIIGLPLEAVFGRWQPGQIMLLILVVPAVMLAITLQILAAIFDAVMSMAVRRRIPGEWSVASSALVSIVFGVALVATILVSPPVLGRGIAMVGIVGGLAVVAAALRLRPGARSSLRAMSR
jgi:hypothetical protein